MLFVGQAVLERGTAPVRQDDASARPRMWFPKSDNNVHVLKLASYFGALGQRPISLPPDVVLVFFCFTNRCGSNYVAELVASSGKFNLAGEPLNWTKILQHSKSHGLSDFHEYFEYLVTNRTRSGHFFVKTGVSQLELLGRAGILNQAADQCKFVLIKRSDRLAQAISHAIAFSTNQFTSTQEAAIPPEALEFSREKVTAILNAITKNYKTFDLFFRNNGIAPVEITYEQLIKDPANYMQSVAQALGLSDFKVDQSRLRLQKQSGSINAVWRDMYLAEAECSVPPAAAQA